MKLKIEEGMTSLIYNERLIVKGIKAYVIHKGRRLNLREDIIFKSLKNITGKDRLGTFKESIVTCEAEKIGEIRIKYRIYEAKKCNILTFMIEIPGGILPLSYETGGIEGGIERVERVIGFHYGFAPPDYRAAFSYYTPIGRGLKPSTQPPPPTPYPPPPKVTDELTSDCWSYPLIFDDFKKLEGYDKIIFMMCKVGDQYLGMLPLIGFGQRGVIRVRKGMFNIAQYSFVKNFNTRRIPGGVIAVGSNPYEVINECFRVGFGILGKHYALRVRKRYPEVFKYLGWCSWNAFLRDVNESALLDAIKQFKKKGIPVKMFLIDDGWHDIKENKLVSFEADRVKFPGGLAEVIRELKNNGVKYVGVWITLQGYWSGIHPESKLAKRYEVLEGTNRQLLPDPRERAGISFYMDFYRALAKCGIDFTKVDNQYDIPRYVVDKMPIGDAAEALHEMLEAAAGLYNMPVLNCMALTPEGIFNWNSSCIARASIDYIPYWKDGVKKHLLFCAYNSLWLSQVVWPDWDMFQTHDPYAIPHAVSRAISGGPVYITDRPSEANPEIANKLAFKDGKLPELLIPALPTPDVIFRDPYNEKIPLKIYNQVKIKGLGLVGIIAAFNINSEGCKLDVEIGPADAQLPKKGKYLIFEYFTRKLWMLNYNEKAKLMSLEELDTALFFVIPFELEKIVIPIGLLDVYISPSSVELVSAKDDRGTIILREQGIFAARVKSEDIRVFVDDKEYRRVYRNPRKGEYSIREDGLLLINAQGRIVHVIKS